MSFKIEDLSSTEKKPIFDIDAKEVAKSFNAVVKLFQKDADLKGFRKGKVPLSLLKKMHGEALLSEAMKSATDTAVKDHFEKKGDKPAYEPKIDLINKKLYR